MRYWTTTTALALVLGGCTRPDADLSARRAEAQAGLGRCTQEEPALPPRQGSSVFHMDTTPVAPGSRFGRYAAMLTCMTTGPAGTAVTVMLPNLLDTLPHPGRYRVQPVGVVPATDSAAMLAWAELQVPAQAGITYRGMGGEVVVEADDGGGLVGSYLIAFERAPEAEQRGPARLVLGGAFAAPRNALPREAALPLTR